MIKNDCSISGVNFKETSIVEKTTEVEDSLTQLQSIFQQLDKILTNYKMSMDKFEHSIQQGNAVVSTHFPRLPAIFKQYIKQIPQHHDLLTKYLLEIKDLNALVQKTILSVRCFAITVFRKTHSNLVRYAKLTGEIQLTKNKFSNISDILYPLIKIITKRTTLDAIIKNLKPLKNEWFSSAILVDDRRGWIWYKTKTAFILEAFCISPNPPSLSYSLKEAAPLLKLLETSKMNLLF